MYQILILIAVVTLVYIIARSTRGPVANISNKNTKMVKCQQCDLNLPESEALQFGDKWFCSVECKT
tara:strand:+ start:144 stop:341 length:198 start_codon:yes stop_codon:yes gene_type:complete